MNTTSQLLDEMMEGPEVTYVIFVMFADKTHKFYTFSDEESQVGYVEYLTVNGMGLGVERFAYGESLLDCVDSDEWLFTVH